MRPSTARDDERGTTDVNGRFTIHVGPPASARSYLKVTQQGFAPSCVAVVLPPVGVRMELPDLVLSRGVRVDGKVEDYRGALIPGVLLHWCMGSTATWPVRLPGDTAPAISGEVMTDSEGHFSLGSLPAGMLYPRVSAGPNETWIEAPSVRIRPESGEQSVVVSLPATSRRLIRVRSEATGDPIQDARFAEELPLYGALAHVSAEPTGTAGEWHLVFARPFGKRVIVSAPNHVDQMVVVPVGDGPIGSVDLKSGTGAITVELPGAAAGLRVRAGLVDSGKLLLAIPRVEETTVDDGGIISWRPPSYGVDAHRKILVVEGKFERAWLSPEIREDDRAAGAHPLVARVLETSEVVVSCVDAADSLSIGGAHVRVLRDPAQFGARPPSPWGASALTPSGIVTLSEPIDEWTTDSTGSATIRLAQGFAHSIRVSADGYAPHTVTTTGQLPARLDVRLQRGARVVVVAPRAAGDAQILAIATWPDLDVRAEALPQIGRVNFGPLEAGSFLVAPRHVVSWMLSMTFPERGAFVGLPGVRIVDTRQGNPVRVELEEAYGTGGVSGEISPFSGASGFRGVDIVPPDLAESDGPSTLAFPIGPDGQWAFGEVPAGRFVLRVFGSTRQPIGSMEIRVKEGEMTRVRVTPTWASLSVELGDSADAVTLENPQGSVIHPWGRDLASPRFVVMPGVYRLRRQRADGEVVEDRVVTLAPGEARRE
jgi:hypothetical protein